MGWIKNQILKRTEKNWKLYNKTLKENICLVFNFTDFVLTGGYCMTTKNYDMNLMESNILVFLNKCSNINTVTHSINHEYLHHSINTCLGASPGLFVETVINEWMLKKETVRERNGKLKVRRLK